MIGFAVFLSFLLFIGITGYSSYRLHKAIAISGKSNKETPERYRLPYEAVSFTTADNITLSGWFIPVPYPKAVVILIHSRSLDNGGKGSMISHALYLYENDYSTFLFDMRGFGESKSGKIGFGENEWKDVAAAYDCMENRLENKHVPIGFLGISLGATAALIAAGKEHIGKFVIASVPFASHESLFAHYTAKENVFPKTLFIWGLLIASFFLLRIDYFLYEAQRYMTQIKEPVFLIAAKKDATVNGQDAWKLYEKANKPKEYWEAPTGHDVYKENGEEFKNKVLRFLQIYTS